MDLTSTLGFKPSSDRLKNERANREALVARNIPFGINFLDRMLRGILPDDLVLLGGFPGSGKTETASRIFQNAAQLGKRVHMFALEAGEGEIERRIKFREYAKLFYADPDRMPGVTPRYLDWFYGDLDSVFARYDKAVSDKLENLNNMFTYYRGSSFDLNHFAKIVPALAGMPEPTDLIIVDHIHYFDLPGTNENRALSDTIKGIRDIAQINNVPVILVAHLRKKDKRSAALVPDLDDFHGTSDLGKVATKAILLAPGQMLSSTEFETYFSVRKFRMDGGSTRYIGAHTFDTRHNDYSRGFELGTLSPDGQQFVPVDQDVTREPKWLRKK
jgi:replicative DNA helicase